jgi:hypothetical protein
MVYAMMSIGVLGFVVWSLVVASLYREVEVINFAVCWKSLMPIGTLFSENSIGFAQSAGNLSLMGLAFVMAILFVTLFYRQISDLVRNKITLVRFHTSVKYDKKGDDKKTDGDVWNFAICWDSSVSIGTLFSKNLIGYAQSAGNLLLLFIYLFGDLNDPGLVLYLTPVKVYSNADIQKQLILSENKEKSGIYLWTNLINGRRYVGSSNNLRKRFWQYYNINYLADNKNMIICRALLKYGYSNFSLTILEYCNVEDLIDREKYNISLLNPEYNVCKEPGKPNNTLGFKHLSETKTRISASRLNNPQLNCKRIEVTDLQTGIHTIYNSINLAGLALNIPHSSIIYNIKSKKLKPYKGRYVFKLL